MTGRRGLGSRLGIVALNLWWPGLGLLRLGRVRAAALVFFGPLLLFLLLFLAWSVKAPIPFPTIVASIAFALLVQIGAWLASCWMSWRGSAGSVPESPPIWSRWYAIAAAILLAALLTAVLANIGHRTYRPFYMPSESMAPTLLKNDRMIALMRVPSPLRRGDVILFRGPRDTIYVKRIAALAGDVIEMVGGQVSLNGKFVPQKYLGTEPVRFSPDQEPVRHLLERFPGEAAPHEIYDSGPTMVDDVPATRVLPGHVFVLGDNRDNSADSRVSRAEDGVEQLALPDVMGIGLYYSYGPSHRSGQRIGPAR